MRSLLYPLLTALTLFITIPLFAQQGSWPKVITTASGTEISVYEFQPQSLNGENLSLQAAVSIKENASSEPVFGILWADAVIVKAGLNQVSRLSSFEISTLKVPGVTKDNDIDELKAILAHEMPKFNLNISLNELNAKIDAAQRQTKLAGSINNAPPKIIYTKTSSILVFIDGEPQVQKNNVWGVEQVVNTPFTIIRNTDQRYYLYGNKKWFTANSVTGNWKYVTQVPERLATIDVLVRKADTSEMTDHMIPEVIVTTVPAELIQSKGEPNFAPVQGTHLLYMTNTSNDIFHDIHSQQYYVLISGRWYKAPNLNSNWTYIAANNLPEDFAKIPEGSAKDAVLSSIAGTAAAEASVLDAQIPQTAKVDRNTATASVDYDGEPQFEQIEGTDMEYAVNTPGAVIHSGRKYYLVENGVWFESEEADGPWVAATERPYGVENIPPNSPVYNVKYVYIYEATPEYVYMGYTPGYLGNYVYGPTIVYGTGYHYRSWRGRRYYARPLTYGFNMRYTPWSGWGFGFSVGSGWFYSELYDYNDFGNSMSYHSPCYGWWGASAYRPQYGGYYNNYYGRDVVINNNYIISNHHYDNVYRSRRDVVSYDRYRTQRSTNHYPDRYANGNNGRNRSGNDNNSGRSRYGTAQNPGHANNSNNSITQRPGRFGSVLQRPDNSNQGDNRNNSEQVNRLPVDRQGRVYRPQQNTGDIGADTENRNNRAGINTGINNGVGYGRNRDENTQPQPSGNNRGIGRSTQSTPEVEINERGGLSRPGRRENTPVTVGPEPQRERYQASERVNTDMIRRPQASRQSEEPQRVYAPQRNSEAPRSESRPAQRQPEIGRGNEGSHSSPDMSRPNRTEVNRTPPAGTGQGSEGQGSVERRLSRPGN